MTVGGPLASWGGCRAAGAEAPCGEPSWTGASERLRRFVEVQLSVPRDDEHGRFNVAFLELNAAAARNERYADALREFSRLQ